MVEFEEVWELLGKYEFDIDLQSNDRVRCVICRKLLVDAFYGPCGCNYCKRCVTSLLGKGPAPCPGDKDECQFEHLTSENLKSDSFANLRVSKLNVKCPYEFCDYYSELLYLSDHLKMFHEGQVKCPFNEIGCREAPLDENLVTDHLVTEIYHHSKLIIEWIINLRNEVTSLAARLNQGVSEKEYVNLKEAIDLRISEAVFNCNNEKIFIKDVDKMFSEVTDLTTKNDELTSVINNIKDDFYCLKREREEQEKLFTEVKKEKDDREKELVQVKMDKAKLEKEVTQLQKAMHLISDFVQPKVEENLENVKNKATTKRRSSMSSSVSKGKEGLSRKLSLSKPDSFVQGVPVLIGGKQPFMSIKWIFCDVSKCRENKWIKSEVFYSVNCEYKVWLELNCGGCIGHIGSHNCVRFRISSNAPIEQSTWPLSCMVNMTIKNTANIYAKLHLKKSCKFERPTSLSCGELFHFPNCDIEKLNLIYQDQLFIECVADKSHDK